MENASANFARLDHKKSDLTSLKFYRNSYKYVILSLLCNIIHPFPRSSSMETGARQATGRHRMPLSITLSFAIDSKKTQESYKISVSKDTDFSLAMSISTEKPQQPIAASPSSEVFIPRAHQWVQLRNSLSEYSEDTALLLCPRDHDRWIAWIPGFGQATLERSQLLKAID